MSIDVEVAGLRTAPPPVRGLRLSSRQQSLLGVVILLVLLPFALRMGMEASGLADESPGESERR